MKIKTILLFIFFILLINSSMGEIAVPLAPANSISTQKDIRIDYNCQEGENNKINSNDIGLNSSWKNDIEIVDFFSDFTSSDVTIKSNQNFQGKAVFQLFSDGNLQESHEVFLKMNAGESVSKVILWERKNQYDYYTAKVNLCNGSRFAGSSSYQVSYSTVALPNFHIVDFSPTNTGVKLLIKPFNPSSVDIKIELLENNDIIYSETIEDVFLTQNKEVTLTWPFLLVKNKKYTIRAKTFMHRLYAPPLINTYIANFIATDDVEILTDEVQADEYGVSVTIRGKSQSPFDGFLIVKATNKITNETHIYRTQIEDILVSDKEDTTGIVWKGIAPGTYDVDIMVVNRDNITIDKYKTLLRIPENTAVRSTSPAKSSPGFAVIFSIIILLVARRLKSG